MLPPAWQKDMGLNLRLETTEIADVGILRQFYPISLEYSPLLSLSYPVNILSFATMSCSAAWLCTEQRRLGEAQTPVPHSDHLAGQRTRTRAEWIVGGQRLRVLTSFVLDSSCCRWRRQTPAEHRSDRCHVFGRRGVRPRGILKHGIVVQNQDVPRQLTAKVYPSVVPGLPLKHQCCLGICQQCTFSGPTQDWLN